MEVGPKPISYWKLALAEHYFPSIGFVNINTPWIVDISSLAVTTNKENMDIIEGSYGNYGLVGSAEQGFIDLIQKGYLLRGRYMSTGPCFRSRDAGRSIYHRPYFMKTELLEIGNENYQDIMNLVYFWYKDVLKIKDLSVEETEGGHDILVRGIEVGSYGTRRVGDIVYSYGTGVAEPRLSLAESS